MAISKILHMKEASQGQKGRHLKLALQYVMNPEKTENGLLIGGINCQPEYAYEQMQATKELFHKTEKRQGYHLVISFQEGEITPGAAFELTGKFCKEYLGKEYEAVFVVHTNTDHIHSHIVFNSVSFLDGKKFRYEKGDWARKIQPITNHLCEEYGISVLDMEEEEHEAVGKNRDYYKEWNEMRDGRFVWSELIKRDLDACMIQANSFDSFLTLLAGKGYEIKQGKYLAVKAPGMTKFRRCNYFGEAYAKESIIERIDQENLQTYQKKQEETAAKIVFCKVKRYKRAQLTGLQKRYYRKLYKLGKLKKRPYSQVWKYRKDLQKMELLQKQYLYLTKSEIHSKENLNHLLSYHTETKKNLLSEKRKNNKEKKQFKELFSIAENMTQLKEAEQSFQAGDEFFFDEHKQWEVLNQDLQKQGYSYEEVLKLEEHFKAENARWVSKIKREEEELRMLKAILKEIKPEEGRRNDAFEKQLETEKRDRVL